MISWAWSKVRKKIIINNRQDICNKKIIYNHAYDIIKHSRILVIKLTKMQFSQTTCPFARHFNIIRIKTTMGKSS